MAKEFLIDTAENIFREDDAEEGTKKLLFINATEDGFQDGDFMSPDPTAGTLEIYYTGSEELKELLMYEDE